jgi:hypothetical protein
LKAAEKNKKKIRQREQDEDEGGRNKKEAHTTHTQNKHKTHAHTRARTHTHTHTHTDEYELELKKRAAEKLLAEKEAALAAAKDEEDALPKVSLCREMRDREIDKHWTCVCVCVLAWGCVGVWVCGCVLRDRALVCIHTHVIQAHMHT